MLELRERARERNQNLSSALNEVLHSALRAAPDAERPFRQRSYALGERPGINFHKSLDLAAEMETDYTIGKMELGK